MSKTISKPTVEQVLQMNSEGLEKLKMRKGTFAQAPAEEVALKGVERGMAREARHKAFDDEIQALFDRRDEGYLKLSPEDKLIVMTTVSKQREAPLQRLQEAVGMVETFIGARDKDNRAARRINRLVKQASRIVIPPRLPE